MSVSIVSSWFSSLIWSYPLNVTPTIYEAQITSHVLSITTLFG